MCMKRIIKIHCNVKKLKSTVTVYTGPKTYKNRINGSYIFISILLNKQYFSAADAKPKMMP